MLKKIQKTIFKLLEKEPHAGEIYKSLFERSHSVMLLIHPDTGNIIDANSAACKYYQYPKEQLLNLSIMAINTLSPMEIKSEMESAKNDLRNYFIFKHKLATGEIRDVEVYSSPIDIAGNNILYSIVNDITDRFKVMREKEEALFSLEKARSEIKTLRGIIPICSYCKKIRDDKGAWEIIEAYICKHSDAQFSHGVCPECLKKQMEDVE